MSQINSSIKVAALALGVSEEAVIAFVNQHNPRPGEKRQDSALNIGAEMALALESINPVLAQRWKEASCLRPRSQNDTAIRMS